jgi:putative transposase
MPNYRRVFLQAHCYFLTVVTHQRNPILVENIGLLREAFAITRQKFHYQIEAVVVLPDHFHLMLSPDKATDYPKIISGIKRHFSKQCDPKYYQHLQQSESRSKAGYKPVWQKKFYEHTIRNDNDFAKHLDYIHFNPVKHGYVSQVKDWAFSSFHRYVHKGYYDLDWCDFAVEELDYE